MKGRQGSIWSTRTRVALGQLTLKQPQVSPEQSSGNMTRTTGRKGNKSPVWWGAELCLQLEHHCLRRQEFQALIFSAQLAAALRPSIPHKAEQWETAQLRAGRTHWAPSASRNAGLLTTTGQSHWGRWETYPGSKAPGVTAGWSRAGL